MNPSLFPLASSAPQLLHNNWRMCTHVLRFYRIPSTTLNVSKYDLIIHPLDAYCPAFHRHLPNFYTNGTNYASSHDRIVFHDLADTRTRRASIS
ncbi:hypothetical protein AN958_10336 [Leucoagaricus sp. SymC.cos]|nr:hypothetical protein AN958_10336 [Leucoagaricus sp. SymC.cos]